MKENTQATAEGQTDIKGEVSCPNCSSTFELSHYLSEMSENLMSFHCGCCDHVFESRIHAVVSKPVKLEEKVEKSEAATAPPVSAPKPQSPPRAGSRTNLEKSLEAKKLHDVHPYSDIDLSGSSFVKELFKDNLTGFTETIARSTVFKLLLVPTLIFIALAGLTYLDHPSSAAKVASVFESFYPESKQLPPPGVLIETTELEQVSTKEGDKLLLLRGKVRNDSQIPLNNVTVEGLLFNDNGERIHRQIVSTGKTILKDKIENYTHKQVEKLSAQGSQKNYAANKPRSNKTIKQGQSHDFYIVLPEPAELPAQQLYYSTRVYSVG